ncbi:quinone oxidoreductase family protein [Saccharopolyspora phatthalungensis]|uniref:NADPH:quinone reductase-like Zn-dependent oxidoreductase n=1 Tax=Saccharopolyspora phatthalungensis TaxID=664693 RepID=A0A840Q012_9PSEU|nr:quinone oxidoreductase [Saccharopolyspora phatthalungensis]MBB5153310.1 NADPH:quinone reductase-like Zn-dependent oxidoreductase [Saccharopolyspora phatthalungensis]
MQAIVVEQLGGPQELRIAERPTPRPGPGQIRVEVAAAGVNFMDTGARRLGPAVGQVPFVPGVEGAGRVAELGEGVTEFAVGDRVAWVYAYGSYAEELVLPATSAVPVPDGISDEVAASVMMQGITAHHFATEAAPVEPGHITLVHAAAGGLGQKLVQLIKARGGTVIGLTSTKAKADLARQIGADHALVSTGDAFVEPVLELTGGQGVHTVFDGGGETTFRASMTVVRRHGTLLYYGAVIGDAPVVNLRELPRSIKICYPVFRDHISTREALLRHTADIFRLVQDGRLRVEIGGRYPLKDAAQAHRDIESRATTGKLLLVP